MKRVLSLVLIIMILMPLTESYAAGVINTRSYYVPYRDEYRVDHDGPPAYTFHLFRTHFTSQVTGQVWTLDFTYYTGIMWLTCNGVYKFQFIDANENVLYESADIITTQIKRPACQSYQDLVIQDDLSATYTDLGNGNYGLFWQPAPGASSYEIWQNGQLVGETGGTYYELPGSGGVQIVGKDDQGNIVGESHLQVPTFTGQPDWGNGSDGSCGDVCQKLSNLLNCPGWNEYMGRWESMLRDVIPPPPDWQAVSNIFAETFVNAFDEYFGDVPDPPSVSEISNHLPAIDPIDSSFDDAANLIPAASSDFDEPFDFDITSGPQIEIIDESEPFDIPDPLDHMDSSGVGVPVIPGDPNNHSGGIRLPEGITVEDPLPQPSVPDPELNPTDPPVPDIPQLPDPPIPDDPDPDHDLPVPEMPEPDPSYSNMPVPIVPPLDIGGD